MKLFSLFYVITLFTITAYAEESVVSTNAVKKITHSISINNTKLSSESVAGFKKINQQMTAILIKGGCDEEAMANSNKGTLYEAEARVEDLNQKYVSYLVESDLDCQDFATFRWTNYETFDAQTGKRIAFKDSPDHVPGQNPDFSKGEELEFLKYEAFQKSIAEIIYQHIDDSEKGNDCYLGLSKDEAIEKISTQTPLIAGLTKNKEVVLIVSPEKREYSCVSSVKVHYDSVKKYLAKDSILHVWLK